MAIIKITTTNFEKEVINSEKPVLLDFWASWCGPCMMLGPIVEELAEERQDIVIGKVDVDEEEKLRDKYRIMSIPTLLFLKDGEVVNSLLGVHSKQEIINMIKN